jgi:Pyridoxamine 5'-phosphate oxidase
VASWSEVEAEAPELAARAREHLDAHTHLTLATLRRDGSPRISGIEIVWRDGDLYIGSMWRAVKAQDLIRDPRFALHSGSEDPDDGWQGDAKVAGQAQELSEAEIREIFPEVAGQERMHSFRLDVSELVVISLDERRDHMVIDCWHAGRGLSSRKR